MANDRTLDALKGQPKPAQCNALGGDKYDLSPERAFQSRDFHSGSSNNGPLPPLATQEKNADTLPINEEPPNANHLGGV